MNNLKNGNPNIDSMFQNEITYDLKTGVQAGKIRASIIGEIDLLTNSDDINLKILKGINKYMETQLAENQPLPPVVLVANADQIENLASIFAKKEI